MRSRYVDPFTPDIPVSDPPRFSGRRTQVELVVDSLYQLKHGKPTSTIMRASPMPSPSLQRTIFSGR
jgi:hypothetical protein